MNGRGCQASFYRPIHRAVEDATIISIQTKDETAVDHNTQVIQPVDCRVVAMPNVLPLITLVQVVFWMTFKS